MNERRAKRRRMRGGREDKAGWLLSDWKRAYWVKGRHQSGREMPEAECVDNFLLDENLRPPLDPAEKAWVSEQGTPSLTELRNRQPDSVVPNGLPASKPIPPTWNEVEAGMTPFLKSLAEAAEAGARNWPAPPPERYPNGRIMDGPPITLDHRGDVVQPGQQRPEERDYIAIPKE